MHSFCTASVTKYYISNVLKQHKFTMFWFCMLKVQPGFHWAKPVCQQDSITSNLAFHDSVKICLSQEKEKIYLFNGLLPSSIN